MLPESVGEVATVGKVKSHDAVVGLEQGSIDSHVGGGAREDLDVDAPLLGAEPVGGERAITAQVLVDVDDLIATIVALAGVSFAVLVCHHRAEGLGDGKRGVVLRGDEGDTLPLALLLPLSSAECRKGGGRKVGRGGKRGWIRSTSRWRAALPVVYDIIKDKPQKERV